MSANVVTPPTGAAFPEQTVDDLADWFDGLAFQGPLDPAGTLFAFLLALVATVALVVLVAAAVRITGLG